MQNIIAMNPEEFKKRTKAFAVRIINLTPAMTVASINTARSGRNPQSAIRNPR
jgi:hypothetical protein